MVGTQVYEHTCSGKSLSKERFISLLEVFSLLAQENYFYIISDQFFHDFPDPYLRGNYQENRPHYFAFKEESTKIYLHLKK